MFGTTRQRSAARSGVEVFRFVNRCANSAQETPTSPILQRGVCKAVAMDPKIACSNSPVAAKNALNSANEGKMPLKGSVIKYGIK